MAIVHKLHTPEEIAARGDPQVPFVRLGERREMFCARSQRLRALAPGNAMQGYLELIAAVAARQQELLDAMPPVVLPDARHLERCAEHGMPPLAFSSHARDRWWCDGLRRMLRVVADDVGGAAREVARRLEGSRDELYEAQASKLLAGVTFGLDTAAAPFVAAGLQVYFTHLALSLGEAAFQPLDMPNLCPACGSRPTASVVRIGGDPSGHRFLHCSLCSTEWHMVRIKCARCESTKGISYAAIDAGAGDASKVPLMAEICAECNHYLKICYMDRDANVEPCADDLATLPLDLLLTDEGREPWGVNFMLVHGDPEAGDMQERAS
jgi:FdhE protein